MTYQIDTDGFIREWGAAHLQAQEAGLEANREGLARAAEWIAQGFEEGRKLLLFGNGGSAADAQHIAAEFVNRFRMERRPLPAVALTTDTSILTAIGNDYGFEQVFEKQVAALGEEGDIAIGISTSGRSRNVLLGLRAAKALGLKCVGMTGREAAEMDAECHLVLKAATQDTPRIQESHILFGHIICDLVERMLFKEVAQP